MTNPAPSWTITAQILPEEFLCSQDDDRSHLRGRLMLLASKFMQGIPDDPLAMLRRQEVRITLRLDPVFTPSDAIESQV